MNPPPNQPRLSPVLLQNHPGPNVLTPNRHASGSSIAIRFPPQLNDVALRPGYQEAHQLYVQMRDYYRDKAYATGDAEVVVIKARMMTLISTRITPVAVAVRILLRFQITNTDMDCFHV